LHNTANAGYRFDFLQTVFAIGLLGPSLSSLPPARFFCGRPFVLVHQPRFLLSLGSRISVRFATVVIPYTTLRALSRNLWQKNLPKEVVILLYFVEETIDRLPRQREIGPLTKRGQIAVHPKSKTRRTRSSERSIGLALC
jgi:hypothetical protein